MGLKLAVSVVNQLLVKPSIHLDRLFGRGVAVPRKEIKRRGVGLHVLHKCVEEIHEGLILARILLPRVAAANGRVKATACVAAEF